MIYFYNELYYIFLEKALLTYIYNFYKDIDKNDTFIFYVDNQKYIEQINFIYSKNNNKIALFTNNFIIDIKRNTIYNKYNKFNKYIYMNRYMDFFYY